MKFRLEYEQRRWQERNKDGRATDVIEDGRTKKRDSWTLFVRSRWGFWEWIAIFDTVQEAVDKAAEIAPNHRRVFDVTAGHR